MFLEDQANQVLIKALTPSELEAWPAMLDSEQWPDMILLSVGVYWGIKVADTTLLNSGNARNSSSLHNMTFWKDGSLCF